MTVQEGLSKETSNQLLFEMYLVPTWNHLLQGVPYVTDDEAALWRSFKGEAPAPLLHAPVPVSYLLACVPRFSRSCLSYWKSDLTTANKTPSRYSLKILVLAHY